MPPILLCCVCGRAHSADSGQLSAGAEQAVLQHIPLLDQTLNGHSIGAALFTQLLTGRQQGRFQCMLPCNTNTKTLTDTCTYESTQKHQRHQNTGDSTFSLCSCCSFSSCILTALSCSQSLLSLVWHPKTQTHMNTTSSVTTVCFITGCAWLTSMSASSACGIKEPSL